MKIQAEIIKFMKRIKLTEKKTLIESINKIFIERSNENDKKLIESVIEGLVSRGFLEKEKSKIKYVP